VVFHLFKGADHIRRYAADDAHVIYGTAYDETLGDSQRAQRPCGARIRPQPPPAMPCAK
jgi:hypothetical protein